MERIFGLIAIIVGTSGLTLMAVSWVIQQRGRKYSPRERSMRKEAPALQGEEYSLEKPGCYVIDGQQEFALPQIDVIAPSKPEKQKEAAKPLPPGEEKKRTLPGERNYNQWYIGVFPARALIEELSLLTKMREILQSAAEIDKAIKTAEPGFHQENHIAEFIYKNNLQYFEVVDRAKNSTAYLREGHQCSADNDRCIFYKGYLWLDPELVDYDLSSPKPR